MTSRRRIALDSPEALAELERRLHETPEEASARMLAAFGVEPDEPVDYIPSHPDEIAEKLPERFYERPRYAHPPSQSLSTRKKPGDRARLVYSPSKPKWRPRRGLLLEEDVSQRLQERRKKLRGPTTARFSMALDSGWKVNRHEQLVLHLDNLSTYDSLLGFSYLARRPDRAVSAARKTKPDPYYQASETFYYALDAHREVFDRTWRHVIQAALAVDSNRVRLLWPETEWGLRQTVEVCRTPLPFAKIHDGPDIRHSNPEIEGEPVAYEVVELRTVPATDPSYVVYHKDNPQLVQSDSPYAQIPKFEIVIRREALDSEGNSVHVSVMGYSAVLVLSPQTVLKLTDRFPDWIDEVRGYLTSHPDQFNKAAYYLRHPSKNRWGFVRSDELRAGFNGTFDRIREEALLHSPDLYEGDCPRFGSDGPSILQQLHPMYLQRLAALSAGELRWRHEWAVDEDTAWEDVEAVEKFLRLLLAAATWALVFCPALVQVFRTKKGSTASAYGVHVRKPLVGSRPILRFYCRGPPSL